MDAGIDIIFALNVLWGVLTMPLLLVTYLYFTFSTILYFLRKADKISKENSSFIFFLLFIIFLFVGNFIWMINVFTQFYFTSFLGFLIFLSVIALSSGILFRYNFMIPFLIISVTTSLTLCYFLQPLFKDDFTVFFYLFGAKTTMFYYVLPMFSVSILLDSFLFASFFKTLSELLSENLLNHKNSLNNNEIGYKFREVVFSYFQVTALFLLPLFVCQLAGRADLLVPVVSILYVFCVSALMCLIYPAFLTILSNRIFKSKIFWIVNSVIALLSFSNTIYLAFFFVVEKTNQGSFNVAIILATCLNLTFGAVLAKMSYWDMVKSLT